MNDDGEEGGLWGVEEFPRLEGVQTRNGDPMDGTTHFDSTSTSVVLKLPSSVDLGAAVQVASKHNILARLTFLRSLRSSL